MTERKRAQAVFSGTPPDRFPVSPLYGFLYHDDHFAELTGLPQWRVHEWHAAPPGRYAETCAAMHAAHGLEFVQPHTAPPRAWRERQEFGVAPDGTPFRRDRTTGETTPLRPTGSGHASDYAANEIRKVFDREDVRRLVTIEKAEDLVAAGANDYVEAAAALMGRDRFVIAGGVVGTLYSCSAYTGLTNLYPMLAEEPRLVEDLSARILERNIEEIRRLAAAPADAIYIDDATAGCDMISPAHYERFSLPYVSAMAREIRRLGRRAILIYFGGVADRLEMIASTGADALSCETSMKGYVNDIADVCRRVGKTMTVFANIDPVNVIEKADDAALEREIAAQCAAGRTARGFVVSTGSPITPRTPLARVRRFVDLARRHGVRR